MTVKTLYDHGVASYLEEAKSHVGSPWCFIHIPKTAGVSFGNQAAAHFRYENVFLEESDYRLVASGQLSYLDALAQKLQAQAERMSSGDIDFLGGHLQYRTVKHVLDSFTSIRLMTFLRDPVDRVISDYRYCLSPAFPNHATFREKFPDMRRYVEEKSEANKIYKYLRCSLTEPANETARRTEATFAFVGLVEQYDFYTSLFWKINGIEPQAS